MGSALFTPSRQEAVTLRRRRYPREDRPRGSSTGRAPNRQLGRCRFESGPRGAPHGILSPVDGWALVELPGRPASAGLPLFSRRALAWASAHECPPTQGISRERDVTRPEAVSYKRGMTNRRFLLGVALATLAMTGCAGSNRTGGGTSAAAADQAVTRVQTASAAGGFTGCPRTLGVGSYVIYGGGPAPGMRVTGTCATAVSLRPHGRLRAVVTFTESWPWKSFHYSGTPQRRLHHSWRFGVLASGHVVQMGDSGDFPPQSVR